MSAVDHLGPQFGDTTETQWSIDVHHASHDEVQAGDHAKRLSHVVLSREHHADVVDAEQLAAQMTTAIHGTMPTRVMPRY